jgi:hypothetical protein
VLYDGRDGREDGVAAMFDDAEAACRSALPSSAAALVALGRLDASGACAANGVSLVGVGSTAVAAACADEMGAGRCAQSLQASPIFTCAAGGMMAGQCDRTCGVCGADGPGGGHRRTEDAAHSLQAAAPLAREAAAGRRLQTGGGTGFFGGTAAEGCHAGAFAADAAAVTAACCDAAGDDCTAGVASVCDARCGMVFVPCPGSPGGV